MCCSYHVLQGKVNILQGELKKYRPSYLKGKGSSKKRTFVKDWILWSNNQWMESSEFQLTSETEMPSYSHSTLIHPTSFWGHIINFKLF